MEYMKNQLVELSIVIPVYNGAETIANVVAELGQVFRGRQFEIILVNDGSTDHSEQVCKQLVQKYPPKVKFIQLAKNFGEHAAVLAGLNHTNGQYVGVLDDDCQNPPQELLNMLEVARQGNYDVVYGCYETKQHSFFRNFGSWFNDRMANYMLKKPKDLYLSSFKIMNRFIVNEIIKYKGSFPYIDGLILRASSNVTQKTVKHLPRAHGRSNYTFKKLVKLWLDMFLNFSIAPLRISVILGLLTSIFSLVFAVVIVIEKINSTDFPVGLAAIMTSIGFFAGIQLILLGMVGEYLGRLFLDHGGSPQYVIRYIQAQTYEEQRAQL